MSIFKHLFSRAALAVALLAGMGAAWAGPSYHVAIDTTASAGDGYLQMDFLAFGATDPLTATVSQLQGAFTGTPELINVGSGADGALTFNNAAFSEFFQSIALGGLFSFDLSFDGTPAGVGNTGFSVSLLNGAGDYLSFQAVQIGLDGNGTTVSADPAFASVTPAATDVPEPAELATLLTGLGLMGFTLRRRSR